MENEQTEVLQCAEWLERLTIRASLGKISKRFALIESSLNLRRLYARNKELEASLQKLTSDYEAVGAGGVSAQRITQSPTLKASSDWLIDGGLLYRLNDRGTNCDEINVTMAGGLRTEAARVKRAEEILNMLKAVQQAEDHIEQPLEMVAAPVVLPEPEAYLFQHEDTGQTMFVEAQQVEWGFEANNPRLQKISGVYTEEQVRELLDKATCTKSQTAQEPFGYFKAEPFGWRDCAETEEGAIALYEAPQPKADARDAQRYRWLRSQPLESDMFCTTIWRKGLDGFGDDLRLEELDAAIDAAIAAAKEMK